MNLESIVLSHLVLSEEYGRKVLPFIQPEYFQNREDRVLFEHIHAFINKYDNFPTKEALHIDLANCTTVSEPEFKNIKSKIDNLVINKETDSKWLLDQTEEWCSWQAIKNAIFQSIKIVEGKDTKQDKGMIPKLLTDALSVGFDTNVGHNYYDDWETRYDRYHEKKEKISTGLAILDKVTNGGFAKGSFNIFVGGTGVGKSLVMASIGAAQMSLGYNVLYVTLELDEFGTPSISERIDANLMDVPINSLNILPKNTFASRQQKLREAGQGKLVVKQYPQTTAGANHFRMLLNELRLKKDFVPDIVYIDYINLCSSSRTKLASAGSYGYYKAVAEELKGLAQEYRFPLVTATQFNREGAKHSDPSKEHTSDSYGVPFNADFLVGIISNEALAASNQYQFKVLKTRYGNLHDNARFQVGVNYDKMRIYDIDPTGKDSLNEDGAVSQETMIASRRNGLNIQTVGEDFI